ncbi:MAG: serine/threonine protein kinase [Gemmatimonadetes bacterium]|nr:serine/threonine protein kinase [Gemmatimonadota bacterium]
MSTWELDQLRAALNGQYDLQREVGRGGMGIVFLARDIRLDRPVAIKTLPAHLASDATVRERFIREARTAAALAHPNIVPIHRAEEVGDLVFFVMGFVAGESVAQRVKANGPVAAAPTIAILSDVAAALGYAHGRGVVHRDVKAENILLDTVDDRAMVTDFGIARLAESAPMTATGTVLGTVHYMSPEQVSGDRVDGRSDLYALGVLAFFMLSGRFPFEHETPSAVLVAHVTRPAPPLRSLAPAVPPALAEVVDRLLSKAPVARYATASDVQLALQRAATRLNEPLPAGAPALLSSADAQAVWERAALLQQMTGQQVPPADLPRTSPSEAPVTTGFQVDDVVAAAAGAGIDRRYVDRALAERQGTGTTGLVRPGPGMQAQRGRWTGARSTVEYEAVIPGELDDDGLDEIADEMRRAVGEFGAVNSRGRTVEFTAPLVSPNGMPRRLQVSVTARHGRTTIRAYEDFKSTIQGVTGGVTGGVGGGIGGAAFGAVVATTKAIALAVPVFALVAVSAYGFARAINRYIEKDKDQATRAIVERLATRARDLIEAQTLPPPPTTPRLGR